jgi:hypothetical protein
MFRYFQITMSILSILVGVVALLLGTYACIVLGFFGGIATIVDAIKATPTDPLSMCWGTIKIIFCWIPEVIGVFIAWIAITFGLTGLEDKRYQK